MRDVIIMTVYDRTELTLMNVLTGLAKQDLTDTEILIVEDGPPKECAESYAEFWPIFDQLPIRIAKADSCKDGAAYNIGGHNNPAWVNNRALADAGDAERIFWLSSDCILPPGALDAARKIMARGAIYVPRVINMDDGMLYLGHGRVCPMMWFVGCMRSDCDAIGGFDEKYMEGMAFEDADFMGRLFQRVGKLVIDAGTTIFHQSHPHTYMADGNKGYEISEEYTKKKWRGSAPFVQNGHPFGWTESHVGNQIIMTLKPAKGNSEAKLVATA